MNKSTLRKIIVGIITIFGFLFFYVGVGTIKHANANQYISMSRAFEVVKESTLYIIGSFFLLYPLFSKVSKNRKINFSRSLVAIVFLIYSVFKFIGTLVLAGDVGMNYYGVSLGEVLKHDLFFYSYLRIYLSYLVFWILVIHPFIVKKNGKIKLEYSRTELKNQSAIFNKLDSLLDSTAVYLSKKINVFLDKGNTSQDPIRTSKKLEFEDNTPKIGNFTLTSKADELQKLNNLFQEKIITLEEYENLKSEIVSRENS